MNSGQEYKKVKLESKGREKKKKKNSAWKWILFITLFAFSLSFLFSLTSESILPNASIWIGVSVVIVFIVLGILFDMIGVAVTSADAAPFHSMSAQKVRGARVAVILKKNADKVSSFCNDVIGDICGIISGSCGVAIATGLSSEWNIPLFWMALLTTSSIAALTIGGKALGKNTAMTKSDRIVYYFAKGLSIFYHPKKVK